MTTCGQQMWTGSLEHGSLEHGPPEFCPNDADPDLGVCQEHAETYDPDAVRDALIDQTTLDATRRGR